MTIHLAWLTGPAAQAVGLCIVYVVLMVAIGSKSQIDAWCMKNPRMAGVIKVIRAICPDPLMLVQGVTLIVFRRLPVAYQALLAAIIPPPADPGVPILPRQPSTKPTSPAIYPPDPPSAA
jgi:hypothetical protein